MYPFPILIPCTDFDRREGVATSGLAMSIEPDEIVRLAVSSPPRPLKRNSLIEAAPDNDMAAGQSWVPNSHIASHSEGSARHYREMTVDIETETAIPDRPIMEGECLFISPGANYRLEGRRHGFRPEFGACTRYLRARRFR